MKKDIEDYRKRLLIIVSCLFIGIISMTLVYAALSTTLNITGTADVTASSFDVTIEKATAEEMEKYKDDLGVISDNFVMYGDAKLINSGDVDGDSVKNIKISVTKPNDAIGGIYKITNTGSIPVEYSSIDFYKVKFTSNSNSSEDENWAEENIIYDYEIAKDSNDFVEGDVLCPGESIFSLIFLGIDEDTTSIPSDSIEISNFGMDLTFVQADANVCD